MLGDGLARVIPDLQGPDDPLGIVGVEPGRRLRVHLAQLLPQGIQAALGRLDLEPGPNPGLRAEVGKGPPLTQGVQVQAGAAHHNGLSAPAENVLHTGGGLLHIPGHAVILPGVGHPHHVVGNPRHLLLGGTGGADDQVPVDLHGVGGDHLSPQSLGQGHPQAGFSRGGGAADEN